MSESSAAHLQRLPSPRLRPTRRASSGPRGWPKFARPDAIGGTCRARSRARGSGILRTFPAELDARSAAGVAALVAARGSESPLLETVAEGDAVLTARLGPRTKARSGEPLRVSIDVERAHFFDPQSEEAIW
jgi:hypothetical protein